MRFPVVYDILLRAEVEAPNKDEAIGFIIDALTRAKSVPEGFYSAFETIRDDNLKGTKDDDSRETNGFVVFTSAQKHRLLARIANVVEAAAQGDRKPGHELIATLMNEFEYLEHTNLEGVTSIV
ncbi:hypothetical protein CR152_30125 [Massilia violaceinigra]|uniref:Uncharacterized protein n=1 Tax=Massilia violaceinigra TaxID=2045208 RepID=A0A2D2DTI8_9BURK|nr:hypothetical protein [Massilia violaceinigra]ATQ78294.1 hypothetical protein CR152_30125 [Massilia violaceinigra]